MVFLRHHPSTFVLFAALLVFSALSACAAAPALPEAQVLPEAMKATTGETVPAAPPPKPLPSATAASSVPAATMSPTAQPAPAQMLLRGDEASVPILLYHHIGDEQPGNRYYVDTPTFRAHMQALRKAGWTAVTTHALSEMLRGNAPLPEKALVITFDDGALDVYRNAFPVMREMGFPGVFFLVSSALGSNGYVTVEQVKEMIAAGWEIGSHSMTHADLSQAGVDLRMEMYQSAVQLETALDIPVRSFAYPFSAGNENLYRLASQFGYTNASCAGWNNRQSALNVFCLSRREIKTSTTVEDLLKLVAEP